MHEMSIAQNLLEIIQQYVPNNDGARVKVIRLRIGELGGVVPESLRFCFSAASEGTAAQGAELQIESVPLIGHCAQCSSDFEVERYVFMCPKCEGLAVELISGNELDIVELELEEGVSNGA